LTSNDITHTLDDSKKQTDLELSKARSEDEDAIQVAGAAFKLCQPELSDFVRQWAHDLNAAQQKAPDDRQFHAVTFADHVPSGTEIATEIQKILKNPDISKLNNVGVQLMVPECGGPGLFFIMPPGDYNALTTALFGFEFHWFDRSKTNDLWTRHIDLTKRLAFLNAVENQIYQRQVDVQATGSSASGLASEPSGDTVLLRLVQTSITRFGVLAVIGFFVSVLVSLYRYNIRLAAFYLARADLFKIKDSDMTASDFNVLAGALTPQLEFGKSSASPTAEIINLLGAAKGLEK
jgi:hypothetical protein